MGQWNRDGCVSLVSSFYCCFGLLQLLPDLLGLRTMVAILVFSDLVCVLERSTTLDERRGDEITSEPEAIAAADENTLH